MLFQIKIIVILESLVEARSASEKYNNNNGGDKIKNASRVSVYQINGDVLSQHSGWIL